MSDTWKNANGEGRHLLADALPNPDWVEPADGTVVEILMTRDGAKKGTYNARTKQVEWSPFTFGDWQAFAESDT